MQAICTLLQTSEGGELPSSIDLKTLAPLGLSQKEAKKILGSFQNGQLQSYRLTARDHYTFTARATNSAHTLLRATDGTVETVDEHGTGTSIKPTSEQSTSDAPTPN
jgi:hypothetical protein